MARRWSHPLGCQELKAPAHVGITDEATLMGYTISVSMTVAFYDLLAGATSVAR